MSRSDLEYLRQVDRVFKRALELEQQERAQYLEATCGEDRELRARVERLLGNAEGVPPGLPGGAFLGSGDALDGPLGRELAAELLIDDGPEPDSCLGPYRLEQFLGAGGMGRVFRARDVRLGREVALKVLDERLGCARRFGLEARSASALSHPNIVTIYDVGEEAGHRYIAMELVDGITLRGRLEEGRMELTEALEIAAKIASALAAAHAKGVIHRDLKPANVMLAGDGSVKVLDFGLAKLAGESPLREESTGRATITQSGVILGTIGYMSPEQVTARPVDIRSDQFSFGVLFYEMITGRRPFQRDSEVETLAAIANDQPSSLLGERRSLPTPLVWMIERCLAKDPAERYESTGDLSRDLDQLKKRLVESESATTWAGPAGGGSLRSEQDIRFCTTADGARLAYSVVGRGPVLVRVLGWFTHLEMEWEWPDLRYFWESLAQGHTVVRYDGRGIGLSDPYAGEFTEETRQLDLEAVLGAVAAEKVVLLGISEGGWTSAAYAIRHPDRISHLILYGAYSRGASARPGYDPDEERAVATLIRKGWGRDTPMFRQIFTSQFFPEGADPGLIAYFNEMQRASADPETAARYLESCHSRGEGQDIFIQVRTPTLVVHCRDDRVLGFEEGRRLAALVPNARFVPLPSGTHYFPTDREVIPKVVDAIAQFVAGSPGRP